MGKDCCDYTSQFVKLAGTVGGIFLVILVLFLIFAKEHLVMVTGIIWAFVVLGLGLGLFQLIAFKKTDTKPGKKK